MQLIGSKTTTLSQGGYFQRFLLKTSLLRAVLGSQQNGKLQRFPIYPLPLHMHSLPLYPCPTSVTSQEPTLTLPVPPRPQLTSGFTVGCVHSVSLGKCMMICVHPCRIIQHILLSSACSSLPFPYPWPSSKILKAAESFFPNRTLHGSLLYQADKATLI